MSYQQIANEFVNHYYSTFQADRSALLGLYSEESLMTYEGTQLKGPAAIIQKFANLPFKVVQHSITTVDAHPVCGVDGEKAVAILVVGQLKTDDDPPHGFSHTFLLRHAQGNYYIGNEMFRLALHNA